MATFKIAYQKPREQTVFYTTIEAKNEETARQSFYQMIDGKIGNISNLTLEKNAAKVANLAYTYLCESKDIKVKEFGFALKSASALTALVITQCKHLIGQEDLDHPIEIAKRFAITLFNNK